MLVSCCWEQRTGCLWLEYGALFEPQRGTGTCWFWLMQWRSALRVQEQKIYTISVIFILINDSCYCKDHRSKYFAFRAVDQQKKIVFPKIHWCGFTRYSNVITRTLNSTKVFSLFHGWLSSWEQRIYCEKSKQLYAIRGKHYLSMLSFRTLLSVGISIIILKMTFITLTEITRIKSVETQKWNQLNVFL